MCSAAVLLTARPQPPVRVLRQAAEAQLQPMPRTGVSPFIEPFKGFLNPSCCGK